MEKIYRDSALDKKLALDRRFQSVHIDNIKLRERVKREWYESFRQPGVVMVLLPRYMASRVMH